MTIEALTTRVPDGFPPEALAKAAAAAKARLFTGLDIDVESRALGLDRSWFDRLAVALDVLEDTATQAIPPAGDS